MATLEHNLNDRVCEIKLWFNSSSLWGKVLPAMQARFPIPTLTDLDLSLTVQTVEPASVVPDSFLGRSAPRLRSFVLNLQVRNSPAPYDMVTSSYLAFGLTLGAKTWSI
jgi:hypothetical protein